MGAKEWIAKWKQSRAPAELKKDLLSEGIDLGMNGKEEAIRSGGDEGAEYGNMDYMSDETSNPGDTLSESSEEKVDSAYYASLLSIFKAKRGSLGEPLLSDEERIEAGNISKHK